MFRASLKSVCGFLSEGCLGIPAHLSRCLMRHHKPSQCRALYVVSNQQRGKSTLSYYHEVSSSSFLHKTLGDVFNETVEKYPDKEFVVFSSDDVRRTFRHFKDEVDRLACGLVHLGVRRGDRVAIWGPNSLEWLHTQFAVASVGAILVNVNPAYRTSELEHALSAAGVKVVVSASTFKTQDYFDMIATICPHITSTQPGKLNSERLPDLESVVMYGGDAQPGTYSLDDVMTMDSEDDRKTMEACRSNVQFDDPSNIIFTSGTTGLPKGATLTHHGTVNHSLFLGRRLGFDQTEHIVCAPPPFTHVLGTTIISLTCTMHGTTMVLPSPTFQAGATIKAIHDEKCTYLFGTPTMVIAVLHHDSIKDHDVTSVRGIFCGGSSVPPEAMKLAQSTMGLDEVVTAYGLTETTGITCAACKEDTTEQRLNTVGRPLDHLEIKVIDPSTNDAVAMGTSGELCIRGWSVMKGYWGQPDKTREDIDENRWFHTGDIVTMDEQGYCKIEGRLKDLIIRGGSNIYPAEVEHLIHTHPSVQEVQVIGIPDNLMGEEVCAAIILKPGMKTNKEDIRQFCKEQISHYKIPRYVHFVDQFPLTVSGKVQKFKLRELIQDELTSS